MINKYTFVLKYNWMLQYVFYKMICIKFFFFFYKLIIQLIFSSKT